MSFECETCIRRFGSAGARAQHMNALNHWAARYECQSCDEEFYDEEDCFDHMDDYGHWAPQIPCEACNLKFHTQQDARRHMDATNHWRVYYCHPCKRGFQNNNNLQMHLKGAAHRANSITCPFCTKAHTTASGVVHHLESGSCPRAPNLNRESIHKFINSRDTSGVITNKQIAWKTSENTNYIASNQAWNGREFECYFCHKGFQSLAGLNQHLASPVHKQKIYHCFGRGCTKQFTALAQLFNHLESESCGATRFSTVQTNLKGIMTGQRQIGF